MQLTTLFVLTFKFKYTQEFCVKYFLLMCVKLRSAVAVMRCSGNHHYFRISKSDVRTLYMKSVTTPIYATINIVTLNLVVKNLGLGEIFVIDMCTYVELHLWTEYQF
jgi:hypothetical protein